MPGLATYRGGSKRACVVGGQQGGGAYEVPGAQAEYLRVPEAQFTRILVPDGPPDDRFIYLPEVLPTARQLCGLAGRQ